MNRILEECRIRRQIAVNWPRWAVRRALRRWRQWPCRITTVQGTRFYLGSDPVDDRILIHLYATATDFYFPPRLTPPPGSLLLDVGAHHGLYAVEALRRYPGTCLIAVEPDPRGCRLIARHFEANGMQERAQIVEAGIGETAGDAFLEYSVEGSWGNRTHPLSPNSVLPEGAGIRVRLLRLDQVLQGQVPYLIKCSAEGAEFTLFAQMLALGLRPEWLIFIAHPHAGSSAELAARLVAAGYAVEDVGSPPAGAYFHARRVPS